MVDVFNLKNFLFNILIYFNIFLFQDPSKHDPVEFLTEFFIKKRNKKPEFISVKLDNSLFKSEVIIQDGDGIKVFKSNGLHENINAAKRQAAFKALNSLGLNRFEPFRDFGKFSFKLF